MTKKKKNASILRLGASGPSNKFQNTMFTYRQISYFSVFCWRGKFWDERINAQGWRWCRFLKEIHGSKRLKPALLCLRMRISSQVLLYYKYYRSAGLSELWSLLLTEPKVSKTSSLWSYAISSQHLNRLNEIKENSLFDRWNESSLDIEKKYTPTIFTMIYWNVPTEETQLIQSET